MPNLPTNKKLYSKIKSEAKRKFKVWPSAYASGWLVKEYKRMGGKYKKISKSKRKSKRKSKPKSKRKSKPKSIMKFSRKTGLSRWFAEEWIDVCKLPSIVPCGRKNSHKGQYPYCRPRYKITSKSPHTARSLSINEIRKRCINKRKYPNKRVYSNK